MIALVFPSVGRALEEERAQIVLPANQASSVKVSFKASPESTPGKGLIAELCLGDRDSEIPVQCLRVDAHPAFRDAAKPEIQDRGRTLEFSAQKGEWEFFVPADAKELILLGVLFGYPDRKLVLDYKISAQALSDRSESGKAGNQVEQRLIADHTGKAESRILRINIKRAE